jgi:hypothetical protein
MSCRRAIDLGSTLPNEISCVNFLLFEEEEVLRKSRVFTQIGPQGSTRETGVQRMKTIAFFFSTATA